MADAAEPVAAADALTLLPSAVQALIFAQLPVDLRARCACVCRGWRGALSERALWTRLDVSRTSGVTARVTDAFLRGAAARAGGALQSLDVSGSRATSQAELDVARANAATLRELRICNGVCISDAEPYLISLLAAEVLLRAAPALRALDADLHCSVEEAREALRAKEGELTALRVHGLRVFARGASEADVLALAADVAAHAWLQELRVTEVPTLAAVDAVLDAALARRLTAVQFVNCGLSAAAAPALARLLGSSALTGLHVCRDAHDPLLDAPAASLLAGALRANTTLTTLQLGGVELWHDVTAAATLLGALTAHPSLRTLDIRSNTIRWNAEANRGVAAAAVGAALAALLAANAPALTALDINACGLGDAGLTPLFEALRHNTHLRTLTCRDNFITEACAADVLLPAVHANAGLRSLEANNYMYPRPSVPEAEEMVARRV